MTSKNFSDFKKIQNKFEEEQDPRLFFEIGTGHKKEFLSLLCQEVTRNANLADSALDVAQMALACLPSYAKDLFEKDLLSLETTAIKLVSLSCQANKFLIDEQIVSLLEEKMSRPHKELRQTALRAIGDITLVTQREIDLGLQDTILRISLSDPDIATQGMATELLPFLKDPRHEKAPKFVKCSQRPARLAPCPQDIELPLLPRSRRRPTPPASGSKTPY